MRFPDKVGLEKYSMYDTKTKYKLIAVIEHIGSLNSGHFIAYKRINWAKDKWVYTSDERILFCKQDIVNKAEAYMLFYQQINSS